MGYGQRGSRLEVAIDVWYKSTYRWTLIATATLNDGFVMEACEVIPLKRGKDEIQHTGPLMPSTFTHM